MTAAELEDVRRQVIADVKKAFADTLVAEAIVALATDARGGASLLDFLDAQRTYRETTMDHLRAGAMYQLEAAVGDPLEP